MRPWKTLETVSTNDGLLELRKRDDGDYLITIAGRVLMSSTAHASELALAHFGCDPIAKRPAPHVLLGGLGMAYTLRAALDVLPADASVMVAELTDTVVTWCRGELAGLTNSAIADSRVRVHIGDVSKLIAKGKADYDAILLDLYEGPHMATQGADDPFYGKAALANASRALKPGGIFAVWGEERDAAFEQRLTRSGFEFQVKAKGGGRSRGRRHPVYVCTLT